MADLRDSKKAMENHFQDAERTFKLKCRRDRLLAKWIAGLIDRHDLAGYADKITDVRFKVGTLELSPKRYRIFKRQVRTSVSRTSQQR